MLIIINYSLSFSLMKLYKEDAPFIVTLVVIIVVVFAPLV